MFGVGVGVKNAHVPAEQFNQELPYNRHLDRGFCAPKGIRIVAIPKARHPDHFAVNLKGADGDHMLHFNPRFKEPAVVRNSTKYGGSWLHEEREMHVPFPFKPGKPFTLEIIAHFNHVQIKVDGEDICQFQHRDNFRQIGRAHV